MKPKPERLWDHVASLQKRQNDTRKAFYANPCDATAIAHAEAKAAYRAAYAAYWQAYTTPKTRKRI